MARYFGFILTIISYLMIIDVPELRIEDKFSLSVILAFSSGRTNSHIRTHLRENYYTYTVHSTKFIYNSYTANIVAEM